MIVTWPDKVNCHHWIKLTNKRLQTLNLCQIVAAINNTSKKLTKANANKRSCSKKLCTSHRNTSECVGIILCIWFFLLLLLYFRSVILIFLDASYTCMIEYFCWGGGREGRYLPNKTYFAPGPWILSTHATHCGIGHLKN